MVGIKVFLPIFDTAKGSRSGSVPLNNGFESKRPKTYGSGPTTLVLELGKPVTPGSVIGLAGPGCFVVMLAFQSSVTV
jgi:hypothetical protein